VPLEKLKEVAEKHKWIHDLDEYEINEESNKSLFVDDSSELNKKELEISKLKDEIEQLKLELSKMKPTPILAVIESVQALKPTTKVNTQKRVPKKKAVPTTNFEEFDDITEEDLKNDLDRTLSFIDV
jgi:hypothetical protein